MLTFPKSTLCSHTILCKLSVIAFITLLSSLSVFFCLHHQTDLFGKSVFYFNYSQTLAQLLALNKRGSQCLFSLGTLYFTFFALYMLLTILLPFAWNAISSSPLLIFTFLYDLTYFMHVSITVSLNCVSLYVFSASLLVRQGLRS